MVSGKLFRTSVFVLAFIVGLLRESLAQGEEFSSSGGEPFPHQAFENTQAR